MKFDTHTRRYGRLVGRDKITTFLFGQAYTIAESEGAKLQELFDKFGAQTNTKIESAVEADKREDELKRERERQAWSRMHHP